MVDKMIRTTKRLSCFPLRAHDTEIVSKAMLLALLFVKTITLSLARCPMGTVQGPFTADCYIYAYDAALWFTAEERCIEKGGHLASVESDIVNSFLSLPASKNCSPDYWIGGAWNLGEPNTWTWSDGRPFRYTNWASGSSTGVHWIMCNLSVNTKNVLRVKQSRGEGSKICLL